MQGRGVEVHRGPRGRDPWVHVGGHHHPPGVEAQHLGVVWVEGALWVGGRSVHRLPVLHLVQLLLTGREAQLDRGHGRGAAPHHARVLLQLPVGRHRKPTRTEGQEGREAPAHYGFRAVVPLPKPGGQSCCRLDPSPVPPGYWADWVSTEITHSPGSGQSSPRNLSCPKPPRTTVVRPGELPMCEGAGPTACGRAGFPRQLWHPGTSGARGPRHTELSQPVPEAGPPPTVTPHA